MTNYRLTAAIVCALFAVGCGDATEPLENPALQDETAAFQTTASSYTVMQEGDFWRVDIPYVFTNPSNASVYLVNCNGSTGVTMEKWTDGEWEAVWSPAIPQCLSPAIVTAASATRSGHVSFYAGKPGTNTIPVFENDEIPGTYRIVWQDLLTSYQTETYPFGPQAPLPMRVSNAFTLRLAD